MCAVLLLPVAPLLFAHSLLHAVSGAREQAFFQSFLAAQQQPDQSDHSRDRGDQQRKQCKEQQPCAPILHHAGGVFPIGIEHPHTLHGTAVHTPPECKQAVIGEAPGIGQYFPASQLKMLPCYARGKPLDRLGDHGLIAGDCIGLIHQLRIGVVAHEKPLPGRVGHAAGLVLFACDHAADHKRSAVDLQLHALQIGAAEQQPGEIFIQQNEILHQVFFTDIAAAQQAQRMEGEKVAADGDAGSVSGGPGARDTYLAHGTPGVLPKSFAAVRIQSGLVQLVEHGGTEGVNLFFAHRLIHRDEAGDLRKALLRLSAPPLRR